MFGRPAARAGGSEATQGRDRDLPLDLPLGPAEFRLWTAAERGDAKQVSRLLARAPRQEDAPQRGGSRRLADCRPGSSWALTSVGDGHARTPTPENPTAIYIAARRGHLEVVQLLLNAGAADADATQHRHCDRATPVHIAAQAGHADVVWCLLSQPGVDITAQDMHGKTAFHHAVMNDPQATHRPTLEVLTALQAYPRMKLLRAQQLLAFVRGTAQAEAGSCSGGMGYDITLNVVAQLPMPCPLLLEDPQYVNAVPSLRAGRETERWKGRVCCFGGGSAAVVARPEPEPEPEHDVEPPAGVCERRRLGLVCVCAGGE